MHLQQRAASPRRIYNRIAPLTALHLHQRGVLTHRDNSPRLHVIAQKGGRSARVSAGP
jgi:hypothetical protein